MAQSLPEPIAQYFAGKNTGNSAEALRGFATSATVKDERRTYAGLAEIGSWLAQTTAQYNDRATVRSVAIDGDTVEVTALVSGTFPGSPAALRFTFALVGDQISQLEITA
jgi:hypothetical protein